MTKKFDFDFTTPSKVVGLTPEDLKKRNFPGATTKGGYGPANAPKVANGGSMISTIGYGTAGDPVVTGAGSALGESRDEKFILFLESLKSEGNSKLIEVLKDGFNYCNLA